MFDGDRLARDDACRVRGNARRCHLGTAERQRIPTVRSPDQFWLSRQIG